MQTYNYRRELIFRLVVLKINGKEERKLSINTSLLCHKSCILMSCTMSVCYKFFQVLFVLNNVLLNVAQEQVQFSAIRQWKYLNYTWPSNKSLQTAITDGDYIYKNIVIAGVSYFDGWYYLTMPRMKHGVPATLGRISAAEEKVIEPLISPFPSWEGNKIGDCNALQNVQNVEIDGNGQMWILDGGHIASLTEKPIKDCSPKLLIFDLTNNTIVAVHRFPDTVAAKNGSFLYDLVVDNNFAYITDNSRYNPGIIVFSRQTNRSWKIRHSKSMQADPAAQHFTINDVPISAPINIAGIAMMPNIQDSKTGITLNEDKQVFYCPLSSLHLYSVNTSVLRNEANSNNNSDYTGEVTLVGSKPSQSDGMFMTNEGILYFGLLSDNSIAKWDTKTPFSSGQQILTRDATYIQWSNSFTMDLKGNIIVLTNTLQKFIYGKVDFNQTNFWLISAYVGQKSYVYNKTSSGEENTGTNTNTVHTVIYNTTNIIEKEFMATNNTSSSAATNQVIAYPSTIIVLATYIIYYL